MRHKNLSLRSHVSCLTSHVSGHISQVSRLHSFPDFLGCCWRFRLRPVKMFVQEPESTLAVYHMPTLKKFQVDPVADSHKVIHTFHFGKFIGHHLMGSHPVQISTFHHKRPWSYQ